MYQENLRATQLLIGFWEFKDFTPKKYNWKKSCFRTWRTRCPSHTRITHGSITAFHHTGVHVHTELTAHVLGEVTGASLWSSSILSFLSTTGLPWHSQPGDHSNTMSLFLEQRFLLSTHISIVRFYLMSGNLNVFSKQTMHLDFYVI